MKRKNIFMSIIVFFFVGLGLGVILADGVKRKPLILPNEKKLAIHQRKSFVTAEGILIAPYGKKIKGLPDNLWIIGYMDKDNKLKP